MSKYSGVRRLSFGDRAFGVSNVIFLTFVTIVTLVPIFIVLLTSFTPNLDILRNPTSVVVIPGRITFDNFAWLFRGSRRLIDGYILTIIRTIIGTGVNILITVLTAYPLSKKNLPFRKFLMMLFVFTMIFSGGLIPTFMVVREMRLLNTFWAMIIPGALSVYFMIIMRNFFSAIPEELAESAHMDGASDITILFKIILPVSLPAIAAISLFYAVWHWNEFMDAVIFITDRHLWPLQMLLREILVSSSVAELALGGAIIDPNRPGFFVLANAVIVVSAIPIICVYPWLQKYFVKGLLLGSVKG